MMMVLGVYSIHIFMASVRYFPIIERPCRAYCQNLPPSFGRYLENVRTRHPENYLSPRTTTDVERTVPPNLSDGISSHILGIWRITTVGESTVGELHVYFVTSPFRSSVSVAHRRMSDQPSRSRYSFQRRPTHHPLPPPLVYRCCC